MDWAAQARPEMVDGTDMVLVGVGYDQADDVVDALLNKSGIDHDGFDARSLIAHEGNAGIDDQPFSGMPVEGHVHADA
jgi:hypothetical protein